MDYQPLVIITFLFLWSYDEFEKYSGILFVNSYGRLSGQLGAWCRRMTRKNGPRDGESWERQLWVLAMAVLDACGSPRRHGRGSGVDEDGP